MIQIGYTMMCEQAGPKQVQDAYWLPSTMLWQPVSGWALASGRLSGASQDSP
jgi:hypothetical protein